MALDLTLAHYQQLAHDHLINHDRAGAFMGIGLGKTATTLAAWRTLLAEGATKAMLVVAPMRVANLTWPNEIRKWCPFESLKIEKLRDVDDRPSGKAQIYLTNYERLGKLRDLSFCDTIVFDELTKAKNPSSERINYLRGLMGTRYRRWGLTGTPRPNSLLELFAQIRLLDDGKRLGVSNAMFEQTYFEPEGWGGYKLKPIDGAKEKIYQRIADLVITLRSSDYLDIPDTTEEDIYVPLPKAAHQIYHELERELMVIIDNDEVTAVNAGVLVNKLLQVCGGAVYANGEERTVVNIHESKIVALKKLLVDLKGETALIACNYIHERERICKAIPGAVDGQKFKGDIEDAWNSGKIKYLVTDPRAMGHGLNMQQGGRNTIWYSPCYSRELYDQLNGRLARRGQDEETHVFRIVCPGTMDDCAIEALRTRGEDQTEMLAVLSAFREQGLTFS